MDHSKVSTKNSESIENSVKLGFAGRLAEMFSRSKLTPLIIISSLILGLMAVVLTPKEEEPQISVPMVDIHVAAPGFTPAEVERKVTEVVERAVWGLDGVEYVYSTSRDHGALITVRFKVGEPLEPSLVKIHHKLMTIRTELPAQAVAPVVKSYSIDDVPFLTLTFSSHSKDDYDLRSLAAPLARELSSTSDLSRVELLGGVKRAVRVVADPKRLAARGVSLVSLSNALRQADALIPAGKNWSDTKVFDVDVGGRISSVEQVAGLAVGARGGSIVRVRDVAMVIDGPEERVRASVLFDRQSSSESNSESGVKPASAVSIVFAKRKGTNVVELAHRLKERANVYAKTLPSDVKLTVTRDYGSTAEDKSHELIEHLILATLSVSVLIALAMGVRAAIVVATAIPVTLALTLALYYFMGYTLNRVTLFALIFSIGILVDDAIVVVENIERHLRMGKGKSLLRATIDAVAEVGNPTILATFTVIAAILPMAFVRGLMGPYMLPIPVGASIAMMLSLLVAFIVTPWASLKLFKPHNPHASSGDNAKEKPGKLDQLYRKAMETLLGKKKAALAFGAFSMVLLLGAMGLVGLKAVKVKMLPFDNKNEFQITVDLPENTTLQHSLESANRLATLLLKDERVQAVQVFAGEAAPYSFSGMVKHTFLRGADYQFDMQVMLVDRSKRKASSHQIIEALRPVVAAYAKEQSAITKVLEIPPGPPVLATMLAEVYGPNAETRQRVAKEVYDVFAAEPSVVDLDTTTRPGRPRVVYRYDQNRGGQVGGQAALVAAVGSVVFNEVAIATLAESTHPEDISVNLSVAQNARSSSTPFEGLVVPSFESGLINITDTLHEGQIKESRTLHRKNLKPVSYVMSELSGAEEAPVYGILKLEPKIKYATQTADVPWDTQKPVIKWDGEWFITYEVFRDLGGAFAVVMILIYVLVVGWFKSFTVPLIIMAPIPISLIGILPGHAMLGAYFTATSMIGFIAGAGIIVRNSIILVDFIEHQLLQGLNLKEAVVSAGVLRFRPMLLTAAAVVVGSAVMLFDPIFQGLAVSLMFGEVAATLLSRFAVPVLYYWFVGARRQAQLGHLLKEVKI